MVESAHMFQFDDLPIKILRADFVCKLDGMWEVKVLSDNLYTELELENAIDIGHMLVSMKAP